MTDSPENAESTEPEIIDAAEADDRVTRIEQRSFEATFASPLPPPQFLDAYESTLPGAADRILSLTEREARHRHEMVSQLVSAEAHQTKWIPRYILALALVTMAFAVVAVLAGYPVAGTLIAVLDLGGVAGSYLYGIWKSTREDDGPSSP
ncbi:MAG: DUF2335 domain-containing protein [Chloroflexi bacterium]|nr:DUF2335 domain-containing protein [Chloroflexota bacterium]